MPFYAGKQTGGGLRLAVEDVLANDHRGVVLVTASGTRGARHLEERQVALFVLVQQKVSSATFISENPGAYDAFWADA